MNTSAAEQRLTDLAVRVDGRNAHNGYCTWVDVRDGIEAVLRELRGDSSSVSLGLARERRDLDRLAGLADDIAELARDIRLRAVA